MKKIKMLLSGPKFQAEASRDEIWRDPGNAHKIMNRTWNNRIALTCLLALSCLLFLQDLGDPYIMWWDEVIHANVVKNVAEHCCLPQLHRSDLGTDYRDWANNTVWLHKPMLSFYVAAAIYKLLGGSLWALRLPGAIYALLTAVVLYHTGHKFFNDRVGLCGAAIFSLNPFTNQLVHGMAFSGFPDLAFALVISVALYLILDWTQRRSNATLRWLGLALGLGYLCKGGLALAPFAVLAGVTILAGSIRDLIPALQSIVVFGIVVLPVRLYWLSHYPVEFRYEDHQQLLHLFRSIESWGAPWHSYLTRYLPRMLVAPAVPFAYFSIGWALIKLRPGKPGFTLCIWTLAYIVPLSFGVSKIENFMFAVLPAIALLIPHVVERLMCGRQFKLVLWLCICSLATYMLSQAPQENAIGRFIRAQGFQHLYLDMSVILAAALAILFVIRFGSKTVTATVMVLASVALLLLYVRINIRGNRTKPNDYPAQLTLRQAGSDLQRLVDKNGLIIMAPHKTWDLRQHRDPASDPLGLGQSGLPAAYLFLMYWSGVDVLDICRGLPQGGRPQASEFFTRFRDRKSAFVMTNTLLPVAPVAKLPIGNLYSIKEIPFEVWSPVASEACQ
jgi:hypothetical protein